jgi:hypothetical protein
MGWSAEGVGVRVSVGATFFLSTSSKPVLGSIQRSIQWVPRVKRQGREADHLLPTNAEVKNT